MKGRPFPESPEFKRIHKAFAWNKTGIGVGDDAAIVGRNQLLCCDGLAEGVHFRWDWSAPADVGWKAVAANVADVLSMGARPTHAVWTVGMGVDWTESDFAGLAKGAKLACKRYGLVLVGGDTVRTKGLGFISLAMLGQGRGRPWLRSGAKAGDVLVHSGQLGHSAAGLALLQFGREQIFPQLVALHRRPIPPYTACRAVSARVHASIDISDGLSSECQHLALQSGVQIVLDKAQLTPAPVLCRAGKLLGMDPLDWVLHGGEDHGILAAVAKSALPTMGHSWRKIGEVGRVAEFCSRRATRSQD